MGRPAGGQPPPYDVRVATDHLRRADRRLAPVIDAVGPCDLRIRPSGSTVAALAESIVHQQLTGRASATIFARLCALFPRPAAGPTASGLLALSDEELRAVGLSAAKVAALKDLARRARAGQVPSLRALAVMDDDTIVQRLTAVRGIGRWTVEMLLVFRLGRPDVLAVDDLGLRKGLGVVLGSRDRGAPPSRDALQRAGEPWRPYRSVASWYLWRAAEQARAAAP
jgi:3-methyladenine DNA glycosylase/8-oxoguanine DNA glycosylase